MGDDIQTVPLAAYESLSSRLCRIIKWLVMGWTLTAIALGLVLVISFSYSEEVMTETVTQEADDYGSNTYAGGDYYDSTTDGYEDDIDAEEGSGVPE